MIDKDINIWRVKFNTGAVQTQKKTQNQVFNYCYEQKMVGLGWKLGNKPKTIDEAILEGKKNMDYANSSFEKNMNTLKNCNKDDLVWALGEHAYYIGRINKDYNYQDSEKSDEFDVHNTKGCEFFKVGEIENVPGKVISSFYGPGQTLRRIRR